MLQVDVVCVRGLPVDARRDLIGVEPYRELPEPRVQAAFVDADRYTEVVVCIARALQVEVDLVDGEGEVGDVDGDEDLAAVLDEAY